MSEVSKHRSNILSIMRKYQAQRLAFQIISTSKMLTMIGTINSPIMVWVSQSWIDYLGFSEDYLTGVNFFDLIHKDDLKTSFEVFSIFQETGRLGFDSKHFINRYLCSDGNYKRVIWNNQMSTEGGNYMVTAQALD